VKKLVVDSKVCTSCGYCEAVCSMVHTDGIVNPAKSRVRVRRDLKAGTAVASVCRQCTKPRCVAACPHYAIDQDPLLGIPVIDEAKCVGVSCLSCIQACPHAGFYYDDETGLPTACDLCGGDPMCIKVCRVYPHLGHAALSYTESERQSRSNKGD
jgi:Fe-S-cluster-containing hydrogenase component 2